MAVWRSYLAIREPFRQYYYNRKRAWVSAVASQKFLTDCCDIYRWRWVIPLTPIKSTSKKIDKISYEEMLELSSLGAKVMQPLLFKQLWCMIFRYKLDQHLLIGLTKFLAKRILIIICCYLVAYSKDDAK